MASRAIELPFITAAPGANDCEPTSYLLVAVKVAIRNGVAVVLVDDGPMRYIVKGENAGFMDVTSEPTAAG